MVLLQRNVRKVFLDPYVVKIAKAFHSAMEKSMSLLNEMPLRTIFQV